MKITTKKGAIYLGTMNNFDGEKVYITGTDGNEYTLSLPDKLAENFAKCEVKPQTFIGFYAVDDVVESFRFTGRFRIGVEKDVDGERKTFEQNVFIGRAARVSDFAKLVQVSLPLKKKEETEWYSLNFFKGEGELGDKALLELQVPEGEAKPFFWAVTSGPRSYKDKSGTERRSYSVRSFGTFTPVR